MGEEIVGQALACGDWVGCGVGLVCAVVRVVSGEWCTVQQNCARKAPFWCKCDREGKSDSTMAEGRGLGLEKGFRGGVDPLFFRIFPGSEGVRGTLAGQSLCRTA